MARKQTFLSSIAARIWLAIIFPMVAFVAAGAFVVHERFQTAAEMAVLQDLAGFVADLSGLVHEMQKERGASATFVGSRGQQLRQELIEQRALTDERRARVLRAAAAIDGMSLPVSFSGRLANALKAVGELDGKRRQITALEIPAPESNAYFTSTIAALLDVAGETVKAARHPEVANAVNGYLNFMLGKERAGQERATGAASISAGRFDPANYQRFVGLFALQEAYFRAFEAYASPPMIAAFRETVRGPAVEEVTRLRGIAYVGGLQGAMPGVSGPHWFDQTTRRINLMKQVEDQIAQDLAALAGRIRVRANTTLWLVVALGVFALIVSAVASWMASRSVTRPLFALRRSMEALSRGEVAERVAGTDRRDEIGAMAATVGVFRDAAIGKEKLQADLEENRRAEERERERRANELRAVVEAVGSGLRALVDGNLTHRVTASFPAEFEKLKHDFNVATKTLSETVGEIAVAAEALGTTAEQLSASAEELSTRTEHQAANVDQTATSMQQMTATVNETAAGAAEADKSVDQVRGHAEASRTVVANAVAAMQQIDRSSRGITEIVSVIDDLAFQTNLLALNAAVEAARAGDAGKGFAVVATEVRALAQRSAEAAKQIRDLIAKSSAQVSDGVRLVNETDTTLAAILGSIERISTVMSRVANASSEQANEIRDVGGAVQQLDEMTRQNKSVVEATTAAAKSLSDGASSLMSRVGYFKTGSSSVAGNGDRRVRSSAPDA